MEKITINGKEVKVGDGATINYYSDRSAVTIIEIGEGGKWIKVQRDIAKRTDTNGMSEDQDYEFSRDPNGRIYTFKRTRKNPNRYTDNGRYNDYGCVLSFYGRSEYFDYSF